ncbi:hypothetical protein DVS77_21745 [Mycolicibacterium moriokaense]|nr:hypothetical protein DVS77_21745 [Mycolicibacterium moriokaense]
MAAALAALGLSATACSHGVQATAMDPHAAPAAIQVSTARSLIDALAKSGFEVPHPLDTTKQVCQRLGCLQSIVCDTLRITSFPTSALARRSALPGVDSQMDRFVVRFAPPMTENERARYWHRIRELIAEGEPESQR